MESPPTTTSYAILGLLALRSWTTYELTKQAQRSLRWFWPRAERKLYDEPKRLVTAGMATAVAAQTGRRRSTVYSITEVGRRELRRWLGEPSAPPTLEFEGMVKVFFADSGSLEQLRDTLRAIGEEAQRRFDELASRAVEALRGESAFPERIHLSHVGLAFHLEQERATIRWAEWASEQAAQWTTTADPGSWDAAAALRHIIAERL